MNLPTEDQIRTLIETSYEIRKLVIKSLAHAQSGHSAGSLGMTDVMTALYFHFMKIDPSFPKDPNRDRLFLSAGHLCPVLYACLSRRNFFPEEELFTLRKINSRLQGHPHNLSLPGVENSSGPLSQGISVGVGSAIYSNFLGSEQFTFIIGSDGELQEGQTWEACMFAGFHQISRLIWIIDRNHIQIGGNTGNILEVEPLNKKISSFGWEVLEMDGNDIQSVCVTISNALDIINKPVAIIAHTVPGKGVDFMEYKFEWHGKAPSKEQEALALASLEKKYQNEKK